MRKKTLNLGVWISTKKKKHEQVLTENNTGESKFQENWSREGKIEPDMKKEEPL